MHNDKNRLAAIAKRTILMNTISFIFMNSLMKMLELIKTALRFGQHPLSTQHVGISHFFWTKTVVEFGEYGATTFHRKTQFSGTWAM